MNPFFAFILALFVIAAIFQIDFFFTIFYLFASIYIVSRLWAQRIFQNLHLSRTLTPRAFLGDEITVTVTLSNHGLLPIPWLSINETLPLALSSPPFYRQVISMGGQSTLTLQYQLQARERGYYKIGPLHLETGDLLGLKRQLTSQFAADTLIVYPQIVPIVQLGLPTHSPNPVLSTTVPLFHDPSRLIGLRQYQPGDTPRHIHWAATAATGTLWVKQFQPAISRENAIFLNLDREDYAERGYPEPAIELAITTAASLANHTLTVENLPLGLVTVGFDPLSEQQQTFNLTPHSGRGHLMQILEVLARVQRLEHGHHFTETIRQIALHLSWGTTIIIITSHASNTLLETALLLQRSGFAVTLIGVNPIERRNTTQSTHAAAALGITMLEVRREHDLERLG